MTGDTTRHTDLSFGEAVEHMKFQAQLDAVATSLTHIEQMLSQRLAAVEKDVDDLDTRFRATAVTMPKMVAALGVAVAIAAGVVTYVVDRPYDLLVTQYRADITRIESMIQAAQPHVVEERLRSEIKDTNARIEHWAGRVRSLESKIDD